MHDVSLDAFRPYCNGFQTVLSYVLYEMGFDRKVVKSADAVGSRPPDWNLDYSWKN